jgi:hypothetical protein
VNGENIMISINTKKFHIVKDVHFKDDNLCLNIDGKDYSFPLKDHSSVLLKASDIERNYFEIDHSGYGIHWPMIDEDISIDGLLGIIHRPQRMSMAK